MTDYTFVLTVTDPPATHVLDQLLSILTVPIRHSRVQVQRPSDHISVLTHHLRRLIFGTSPAEIENCLIYF